MPRPTYRTRKDATSHAVVRRWLEEHNCHPAETKGQVAIYYGGWIRGLPLCGADISNIGGWSDWLIWIGEPGRSISCTWECKEPGKRKDLTSGEEEWRDRGPTLFTIITTLIDCDTAAEIALGHLRHS